MESNIGKVETYRRYNGLDLLKIILAFVITDLHLGPLRDIAPNFAYVLNISVDRVAVPTFFLISGFLMAERDSGSVTRKSVYKFAKRNFELYCAWTVIYLPLIIDNFNNISKYKSYSFGVKLLIFVRRFFLIASWTQLWFLIAGVYGVLLFYFIVKRIRSYWWTLGILFGLMTLFSIFEDCYMPIGQFLCEKWNILNTICFYFPKIFGSFVQNSSWAAFCYCLGYVIVQKKENSSYLKYGVILTLVGGVALAGEIFVLFNKGATVFSRMTSLIVIAIGLLYIFRSLEFRNNSVFRYMRRMSILMYGFHGVYSGIGVGQNLGTLQAWGEVVMLSVCSGAIIIGLSEKTNIKWLYYWG